MEGEQLKLVSTAVAVVVDVVCAVYLNAAVYGVDILETQTTSGHIAPVAQFKRLADGCTDFSLARRVQGMRMTRAPADAGEARGAHVFVRRQIRNRPVGPSIHHTTFTRNNSSGLSFTTCDYHV